MKPRRVLSWLEATAHAISALRGASTDQSASPLPLALAEHLERDSIRRGAACPEVEVQRLVHAVLVAYGLDAASHLPKIAPPVHLVGLTGRDLDLWEDGFLQGHEMRHAGLVAQLARAENDADRLYSVAYAPEAAQARDHALTEAMSVLPSSDKIHGAHND